MDLISELRWRPTIADPTYIGWFTVAAYAIGAVLSALVARRKDDRDPKIHGQRSKLWLAATVVMAVLCVDRQLYLHTLLTAIGRVIAQHQGWYGQRGGAQKWSVVTALIGAAIFGCWFIWRFHALWAGHWLLATGLSLLLTLTVVRVISFHPVDVFLHTTILGLRMNRALELAGILLVSLAALKERSGRSNLH